MDASIGKSHSNMGGPEACTSNGSATGIEGSSSAYSSATTVSCYNSSPITPLEDGAAADKGFATWNGLGGVQADQSDQHSVKIQRVPRFVCVCVYMCIITVIIIFGITNMI
jgi:hypothetical protein